MSVPKGTRLRNATMQGHQRGTFEGKGMQLTQIRGDKEILMQSTSYIL